MTLALVLCVGWLAMRVRHVNSIWNAIERVRELGGQVTLASEENPDEVDDRNRGPGGDEPENAYEERTKKRFDPATVERRDRPLDAPRVVGVFLAGSSVQDDDLTVLESFANLEWLNLSTTHITDRGLERLASLTNLSSLSTLDLRFSSVTPEGVARLKKQLPRTTIYGENDGK